MKRIICSNCSMGFAFRTLLMLFVFSVCLDSVASSQTADKLASVIEMELNDPHVQFSFSNGFRTIWGGQSNLIEDGENVHLKLDKNSGAGFKSKDSFHHGFFSASIKLPANYSAGVVTAFYTSNAEVYPNNHDELDFEFLGVVPGKPYTLQTNIYGNGSVSTGREERIHLWFDPTADFHRYSVLWNHHHIVFFVDDVPIRQMIHSHDLGGQYPSKSMFLYSTIWDGSPWATEGGKYPVEYSMEPFIASFTNFKLHGCAQTPSQGSDQSKCMLGGDELHQLAQLSEYKDLNPSQKHDLQWARSRSYLMYSYCNDVGRYPEPLPDCKYARSTQKSFDSIPKRRKHKSHKPRKDGVALAKKDLDHSTGRKLITSASKDILFQQLSEPTTTRRSLVTKFSSGSNSYHANMNNKLKFADLPPSLRAESNNANPN